jgi:hypothetical protein
LPAVLSVCTNTAWPASLAPAGLDALAKAGMATVATAAAATAAAAVTRIAVLTETPHAWGFGVEPSSVPSGEFPLRRLGHCYLRGRIL